VSSDPLITLLIVGSITAALNVLMLWAGSRAVGKAARRRILLALCLILIGVAGVMLKVVAERFAIQNVAGSPDFNFEVAAYVERRFGDWVDWTVYVRPNKALLLARGEYLFHATNLTKLEMRWTMMDQIEILCDCSAGALWEVKDSWKDVHITILEVPSRGSSEVPKRPDNVPERANRVGGKWIMCEPPQHGEPWNDCKVYADQTGSVIASGRYKLRVPNRPATQQELRYVLYENTFDKPEGGWIYLRDGILEPIVH
jgi:hypothetical protein